MEALHELNFGGGLRYDDIEDHAKLQLIWILLANTSFIKASLRQKLWKFAEEDSLGKLG